MRKDVKSIIRDEVIRGVSFIELADKYNDVIEPRPLAEAYYRILDELRDNRVEVINRRHTFDYYINTIPAFLLWWCERENIDICNIKEFHDRAFTYLVCITGYDPPHSFKRHSGIYSYLNSNEVVQVAKADDMRFLDNYEKLSRPTAKDNEKFDSVIERINMSKEQLFEKYTFNLSRVDRVRNFLLNAGDLGEYTAQEVLNVLKREFDMTRDEKLFVVSIMMGLMNRYVNREEKLNTESCTMMKDLVKYVIEKDIVSIYD